MAGVQSAGTARGIGEAWAAIRARLSLLSVLIGTSAVALLIDFVPTSVLHSRSLRATAETVITLFAFGGASLLRAQFGHSRRLRDLLLFGALLTLGMTSLFSRALPPALDALDQSAGGQLGVVALLGELFVAAAFAAAATAPADRLIAGGRPVLIAAVLGVVAVAVAELGGFLLSSQFGLVAMVQPARSTGGAAQHPLALVFELCTTGLLVYGSVLFASRDRIEDNVFGSLLAVGAILLAAASFSHVGLPLTAPERTAPREAVLLLASALLIAASVRQELRMRKGLAQAAAMAERRRVAEDLHDGLAQDLAFIAAHGARIADQLGDAHPVAIAARRALDASRSTIAELTDPAAATAEQSLEAIAYELRNRFEITIAVHAQLDDEIAPGTREQVARMAREAIGNAARHGRANNVIVSLKRTHQGVVLRVVDDGSGIANTCGADAPNRFGLRSMRDRATSFGGQLTVRQRRKGGTEIELMLP